ncbi:hypothetical protein AWC38_SpisGene9249 [Stylophora pistillata]|uniref:Uncharacterized protein n=1 Tax=Stylophora pistillata TaxID=50429 RepID=A0A2B4S9L9_STYPI|nr:hypothetical protein AWC38_SpisGene9249 [Stylophora pistillata]
MAAETDDTLNQLSPASVRFTRQAGLERRRPSKRQTTLRSFKIKTNWRDRSTQVTTTATVTSSQAAQPSAILLLISGSRSPSCVNVFPKGSPGALPSRQELFPVPETPDQAHANNSTDSSGSPLVGHLAASISNVTHYLEVPQDSSPVIPRQSSVFADHEKVLLVTRSRTPDGSPSYLLIEKQSEKLMLLFLPTDQGSVDRTPNQSLPKLLSDKTPVSGPVAFKTRNSRKRRGKDAELVGDEQMELLENEYRENNFVRLFNADHGRKKRMSEITDLDVILTSVEEEALEIRVRTCLENP